MHFSSHFLYTVPLDEEYTVGCYAYCILAFIYMSFFDCILMALPLDA